jgi:hypothetical protein
MEQYSCFYSENGSGQPHPVPMLEGFNTSEPPQSKIVARDKSYVPSQAQTTFSKISGGPFELGEPNPATFCQGEDAIFDAYLYFLGAPFDHEKYRLQSVLKTSQRSSNILWRGETQAGIYPDKRPGVYTVWIPAAISAGLSAGAYYLDLFASEHVGAGAGPHDRTALVISTTFNLIYCSMSPWPENVSTTAEHRAQAEPVWPNAPNTIGI